MPACNALLSTLTFRAREATISIIISVRATQFPQPVPNAGGRSRHLFSMWHSATGGCVEPSANRSHIRTLHQPARAGVRSVPRSGVIGFDVGRDDPRKSPTAHPVFRAIADASQRKPPVPDADLFCDVPAWLGKLSIFQPAKLDHTRGTPYTRLANAHLEPSRFRRLLNLPTVNRVGAPQLRITPPSATPLAAARPAPERAVARPALP